MQLRYKNLFEEANLGVMRLKNRIIMAPMGTGYAETDSSLGPRFMRYYEERAKGEVGLIIMEGIATISRCQNPNTASLADDSYIPQWQEFVKRVHGYGAKVAVQLMHSGWEWRSGNFVQVAPSALIVPSRLSGISGTPPLELRVNEIEEIIKSCAETAIRVTKIGLDGIEIHAAHQYLLSSFLSSATNQRSDRYGGPLENRARFLCEIIKAIRKIVEPDLPVWPRINGSEYGVENGVTIEESKELAAMVESCGASAIHVSAYGGGTLMTRITMTDTPGALTPLAKEIKKCVNVPVITVGRLDAEIGEKIIEEGSADFIAIGRRLMADAFLCRKTADGEEDTVNTCIGCFECIERMSQPGQEKGVTCTVNPVIGKEAELEIRPTTKQKNIVVIGSGPAGMEAARVAALRGHVVTLFEKEGEPGGQLRYAAVPPGKADIGIWLRHKVNQLKKAGVRIELNSDVTPETLLEMNPDTIIIATGASPMQPEIPGYDGSKNHQAQEVLAGKVQTGQEVVIVGGGMVGCETAYYLADSGKNVIVIEQLARAASEMFPMMRRKLLDNLKAKPVTLLTETTCREIKKGEVHIEGKDREIQVLRADTIIIAIGYQENDVLYRELKTRHPDVRNIGDSSHIGKIFDAVREGYQAGYAV